MKNIFILIIGCILMSSCSVFNSAPTPTLAPSATNTRTPLPSATATVPSVTFTSTPTLIEIPRTDTALVELSSTQTLESPIIFVTPNTVTPSPKMQGFVSVLISVKEFYKGKKCQPASVYFTAQVSEPARSAHVVLFVRFKSKRSGVTSEWTSIKMDTNGLGTFTHDLTSDEMIGVASFTNPWVEYQLVTTLANGRELGRTDIFSERLSLFECNPALTPQISQTPTVLTP